jgi:hypothetical protein
MSYLHSQHEILFPDAYAYTLRIVKFIRQVRCSMLYDRWE